MDSTIAGLYLVLLFSRILEFPELYNCLKQILINVYKVPYDFFSNTTHY